MEKKHHSNRVAWGTGRIVFRANFSTIQEMIEAGWPMTTVYRCVKDSLDGLSYRQFTDHVRKHSRSGLKEPGRQQRANKMLPTELPKPAQTKTAPAKQDLNRRGTTINPAFRSFEPGPKVPNIDELF